MRRYLNWRLLLLLLIAVVAVAILVFLPIEEYLQEFMSWVRGIGIWGPVLVALTYIPACILCIPGSLISMGAGFVFGPVVGTVCISFGSTAGAAAAFWVSRTLARGLVENRIKRSPRFHALDRAVAQQGFKIVLLTRLCPIFPFNFLNYAFGLTHVRFRDYLLASWIGMLPGTILYAYFGASARKLAHLASGKAEESPLHYVLYGMGLIAIILVTILLTRMARQALAKTAPDVATAPKKESPHE